MKPIKLPNLNETTRVFPRTESDAFRQNYYDIERQRNWEWLEGHADTVANQVEFWTYIALAFAAGFLTHLLWGAK
jgi:hypothetical protein